MERFTTTKGTINKLQRANKQTDLRRDNKRLVCSWALRKQEQDGWGNDGCTKSVWLPRPYQIPRPLLSYPTSAWCPALPCPATTSLCSFSSRHFVLMLLVQSLFCFVGLYSVTVLFCWSLSSHFTILKFLSWSYSALMFISLFTALFSLLVQWNLFCSSLFFPSALLWLSALSFSTLSCPGPPAACFIPSDYTVFCRPLLNSLSLSSLPFPLATSLRKKRRGEK